MRQAETSKAIIRSGARACARITVGLLGLALGSCLSVAPGKAHATPYGTVRADTIERAREVGELLGEIYPVVHAALPDALDRKTQVWVQKKLRRHLFSSMREHVSGFTVLGHGRIHLREDDRDIRSTLAHELVHALMGESWEPLPAVMEEGLGDLFASRLDAGSRTRVRPARLLQAASYLGGFELEIAYSTPLQGEDDHVRILVALDEREAEFGPDELLAIGGRGELAPMSRHMDQSQTLDFYGFGYLLVTRIVDRIGIEGLHELCLRAKRDDLDVVPVAWIYAAAGIDERDGWSRVVGDVVDASDIRDLVYGAPEIYADMFTRLAVDHFAQIFPQLDAREFLDQVNPRIVLARGPDPDTPPEVLPLARLRPVRLAILSRWPTPRAVLLAER